MQVVGARRATPVSCPSCGGGGDVWPRENCLTCLGTGTPVESPDGYTCTQADVNALLKVIAGHIRADADAQDRKYGTNDSRHNGMNEAADIVLSFITKK